MKVAVIGSRTFNDYEKVVSVLNDIPNITKIVSGGAKGADYLGEKYAYYNTIPKIIHLPEWDKYGKKAGFVRNKLIVDDADIVVAFWDGISLGTKSSIEYANKTSKKVVIIYSKNN